MKVYTICHCFQAVSSRYTLSANLSSMIRVYTICNSQSDQVLQYLPFSAVWSGSTVIAILSSLIRVYTNFHIQQFDQGLHYLPFSAVWSMSRSIMSSSGTVWSRSTLFTILSNQIKVMVYTVILRNSLIRVYTVCHSKQSDQGLHWLPFSAVWSGSTQFAILSSLIRVYTVPFSVWSISRLFAILNSLIRAYTICNSQRSDQGLNCLPFSALW